MTDISHYADMARHAIVEMAACIRYELTRPSLLWKPTLSIDGDKWCALFGENLQEGVSGFGDTPDEAMTAFDKAWWEGKTPKAIYNFQKGEPR